MFDFSQEDLICTLLGLGGLAALFAARWVGGQTRILQEEIKARKAARVLRNSL